MDHSVYTRLRAVCAQCAVIKRRVFINDVYVNIPRPYNNNMANLQLHIMPLNTIYYYYLHWPLHNNNLRFTVYYLITTTRDNGIEAVSIIRRQPYRATRRYNDWRLTTIQLWSADIHTHARASRNYSIIMCVCAR